MHSSVELPLRASPVRDPYAASYDPGPLLNVRVTNVLSAPTPHICLYFYLIKFLTPVSKTNTDAAFRDYSTLDARPRLL